MYKSTSFRFPCYQRLFPNFGKVDAIVGFLELSLRYLVKNMKDSNNGNHYLTTLAKRHKLKLDHVELSELLTRASQLYVLNVYQQIEEFLENFRNEHPDSINWQYQKGDTLLTNIIKNIGLDYNDSIKFIGILEVDIFNYYRKIRNRFMHSEIDKFNFEKNATKLKAQVNKHKKYNRLIAPNSYNSLVFDDFVLFTQISKIIAKQLCVLGKPSDEQIVQLLLKLDNEKKTEVNLRNLKRFKNNTTRLKNSLNTLLRKEFSLAMHESENIINLLVRREPLA